MPRKPKRWTKTDLAKKPKKSSSTGAPMCKLCHSAHWNRDPHKFRNAVIYDDCAPK
jgi:hypothetical protein